jgi:hypothetical protein
LSFGWLGFEAKLLLEGEQNSLFLWDSLLSQMDDRGVLILGGVVLRFELGRLATKIFLEYGGISYLLQVTLRARLF